jgi:hypothetical protein
MISRQLKTILIGLVVTILPLYMWYADGSDRFFETSKGMRGSYSMAMVLIGGLIILSIGIIDLLKDVLFVKSIKRKKRMD